jgi:hypothetical protein
LELRGPGRLRIGTVRVSAADSRIRKNSLNRLYFDDFSETGAAGTRIALSRPVTAAFTAEKKSFS